MARELEDMTAYEHAQTGRLMLVVLFLVFLLYAVILSQSGLDFAVAAVMIIVLFILASFATLKVTIDEKYLKIKFGYGMFRKRFFLNEIMSAKAVKNHWYYGWGVKVWFWPYMWIYNVSGFDAVEIIMKNGRRYRIGTDEPQKLEQAITQAIS